MDNDTQFCTECGFKMDKNFGFCPRCGAKISREKQEPALTAPPLNQANQSYGMNYTNNNNLYNHPGNVPTYPPHYNQYGPTQYIPPKKNSNTPLIIVIVVIGMLILAAMGFFGLKLLQGKMGASTNYLSGKNNVSDQDVSGIWEGTVIFNDAKNLKQSTEAEQVNKVLNKPLKTLMEIVPGPQSRGQISIYLAEKEDMEPSSDGLTLPYVFNNGNIKAELNESGSGVTVDFKLENKNGNAVLKGLMTISAKQSDGSTGSVKGTVEISKTTKKTVSPNSSSKDKVPGPDTGNQGGQKNKQADNSSDNNKEPGTEKNNQTPSYIKDPAAYLPKPSMKYKFECWYQDGDHRKTDVVTGVIPKFSIVTSVEIIEQSEPFTQHFVDGADGVYIFSDEEFNKRSSLWLPFNAKVGQSWNDEGVSRKIIQLGASCNLEDRKLDNCIVMEVDYSEAGVVYVCYIAPGLGTVLIKDKDSGNTRLKLLSVTPLSDQEANDIVKRYSPNVINVLNK